jgi:hypothetical protein
MFINIKSNIKVFSITTLREAEASQTNPHPYFSIHEIKHETEKLA